jgi:Tfp pilus assembly protein PilO
MKATDRAILFGLLIVAMAAAFWFLVIAPKREEISLLDDEIAALEQSVAENEELAAYAETAKADYKANYSSLVVLGKAVPGDDDSASLIEQIQSLATDSKLDFRAIGIADGAVTSSTPPPAAETTADPPPEAAAEVPGSPVSSATPTEAVAATLPIGATVGPAGLPVMPYDMSFRGDFFEFADFLADIDGMVRTKPDGVGIDGRLLTVDGFTFEGDQRRGFPFLKTSMRVTSYVAPADQGLTGGATAEEPAPTTPAASSSTPASTTGSVTP